MIKALAEIEIPNPGTGIISERIINLYHIKKRIKNYYIKELIDAPNIIPCTRKNILATKSIWIV